MQVYPRVYGGTATFSPSPIPRPGLSPRVRGNLGLVSVRLNCLRSIPACTGEPFFSSYVRYLAQVYPRVYGGTQTRICCQFYLQGLSPRVRGNLFISLPFPLAPRSIPACTGEPRPIRMGVSIEAVYPRVYGGTASTKASTTSCPGLSPRVRGNPRLLAICRSWNRSIPACTGEPTAAGRTVGHERVYPRVYGGTPVIRIPTVRARGLSPRVRGNRL